MSLKDWSERPRTLAERLAWDAVIRGDAEPREINWSGAKREPFLSLERAGWRKVEHVTRGHRQTITIHWWQSPEGDRAHLKVRTS